MGGAVFILFTDITLFKNRAKSQVYFYRFRININKKASLFITSRLLLSIVPINLAFFELTKKVLCDLNLSLNNLVGQSFDLECTKDYLKNSITN